MKDVDEDRAWAFVQMEIDEKLKSQVRKTGVFNRVFRGRETAELPVHKREAGVMYCNNVGYAPDFSIKDEISRICRGRDGW